MSSSRNTLTTDSSSIDISDEKYALPVRGSTTGKLIYPNRTVTSSFGSAEDYNQRFSVVKDLLKQKVDSDVTCRSSCAQIVYAYCMVGTSYDRAEPSIVLNAPKRLIPKLRRLFRRLPESYHCRPGFSKPWPNQVSSRPRFTLVYQDSTITRNASMMRRSVSEEFPGTYCGAVIENDGRQATVALSLDIDNEQYLLTVAHLFSSAPQQPNSAIEKQNSWNTLLGSETDDDDCGEDEDYDDCDSYEDESECGEHEQQAATFETIDNSPTTISGNANACQVADVMAHMDLRSLELAEKKQFKRVDPKIIIPSSRSDLDFAIVQVDETQSGSKLVNMIYPDGPEGLPVVIDKVSKGPEGRGAKVLIISRGRRVRYGYMRREFSYLGSSPDTDMCRVWTAILSSNESVLPGDCGSVVVDRETFQAYGYIVASDANGHAFIVPLVDVFERIKDYFKAHRVSLPVPLQVVTPELTQPQESPPFSPFPWNYSTRQSDEDTNPEYQRVLPRFADIRHHFLGKDSRLERIRGWLGAPDPSTNLKAARYQHQTGTCQWILGSDKYVAWKSTSDSLLWLKGLPGAGKTILSSVVVDDLERNPEIYPNLAYFFFDFHDVNKRSIEKAIRSLIVQLYEKRHDLRTNVDDLYSSWTQGRRQPSSASLQAAFLKLLQRAGRFWIVLDALDECDTWTDDPSSELFQWLHGIRNACPDIHLLVTSRPQYEIMAAIKELPQVTRILRLQNKLVEHDVSSFIKARCKSMRRWQYMPDVQQEIVSCLTAKAEGVFRWVSCQLDALEECADRRSIRRQLADLPHTLEDTYARILRRIRPENLENATRLLQFLAYSDRPLQLKEAIDVVAVDISGRSRFNPINRMPVPEDLVRYCQNLVTLVTPKEAHDGETPYVRLAHLTVQEYLRSDRLDPAIRNDFNETTARMVIVDVCLSYLLDLERTFSPREIAEQYPLAQYSARYWMKHMKVAELSEKVKLKSMQDFLFSQEALHLTYMLYAPDYDQSLMGSGQVDALYYASYAGLLLAVTLLLERQADVNSTSQGLHGTALHAASFEGHKSIVELLLQKGADVNARAGRHGATPLHVASFGGHMPVVEILLREGADKDILSDCDCMTALQVASFAGHYSIVELLLGMGADVNQSTRYYGTTALQLASLGGDKSVVKLLLRNGAGVNAQVGAFGTTALQAASFRDDYPIFELLLEWDARKDYALHYASKGLGKKIVEVLVELGEDLNKPDNHGQTPLHLAVSHGNLEGVMSLIQNGAEVNALDQNGRTPLIVAAGKGNTEIVRFLLESKANCDMRDRFGNDARAYATDKRFPTVSKERGRSIEVLLRDDVERPGSSYFSRWLPRNKR